MAEYGHCQQNEEIEQSELLQHESIQDVVCQDGDLELNSLQDVQPAQTDKRISDVVGSAEVICQSHNRIQHRLEKAS